MPNDYSDRGGPRRPGGGFRPRGDGPRPSRPAGPASEGDRPRKPFFRDGDAPRGPRRDFGDAPKRSFGGPGGPGGPRRDGDAPRGPRRDFGGPGDAPKRSFDAPRDFRRDGDAPRGPRRDFGGPPSGPRRDFGDAPKRSFGGPSDAPKRSFDAPRDFRRDGDAPRGPRRDFGGPPSGTRRDFGDAPKRSFGGPSDAPKRSFDGPRDFRRDGDAPRGPRRDFGGPPSGPRRDFGDSPKRSFGGPSDAPKRNFDGPRGPGGPRRDFGDAPRRSFDGPGGPRRDGDAPRGPRRDFGDAPKRSFDGPRGPRRDGDAPRGPRRDFGDAPKRDFAGPRDFHRSADAPPPSVRHGDAPRRAFFKAESDAGTAALHTDAAVEMLPVATTGGLGNDDWEVPLGHDEPGDGEADTWSDDAEASTDPVAETDGDGDGDGDSLNPDGAPVAIAADERNDPAEARRPALRSQRPRDDVRRDSERHDSRGHDHRDSRGFDSDARRAQRQREVRVHGMNACMALVRDRRDAIRKVYLRGDRAEAFEPLLEWCRNQHIAYRYVQDSELYALTESEHHEGICLEIERKPWLAFETLLNQLKLDGAPKLLLLLDGVGNPHNIGGILRAAAHFGVNALLLPPDSTLQLSAASYRTAEGGAEIVPIVKLRELERDLEALSALDFHVIGSFPREATSIHTTRWPDRTVLVIGSEQNGIRPETAARCDRRFTIPGSGSVESLNAATATAVLLSAYAGSLAREAWAAGKA